MICKLSFLYGKSLFSPETSENPICKSVSISGAPFRPYLFAEKNQLWQIEPKNELKVFLSIDEMYILKAKHKASGIKSKSSFIRMLILYGLVYHIDYAYLRDYNTTVLRISSSLNQIANCMNVTENVYESDIKDAKQLIL